MTRLDFQKISSQSYTMEQFTIQTTSDQQSCFVSVYHHPEQDRSMGGIKLTNMDICTYDIIHSRKNLVEMLTKPISKRRKILEWQRKYLCVKKPRCKTIK